MKTRIKTICLLATISFLIITGCQKEGPQGPAGVNGLNATVYYSEWFSPTAWSGGTGDWYFAASAPDLTQDIVEGGVVLAYAWLDGDLYESSSMRPLPAYAVGANWGYLIHEYGSIEFTTDMIGTPATMTNKFRFIAIPGTIPASKSGIPGNRSTKELRSMSYKQVCKLYNIPE
ncbi:MAG: hypothetical protein NTW31_13000 [Bacteroidetes bacterium]|nr:hypothetical protein [Bacteroidota bacterium]